MSHGEPIGPEAIEPPLSTLRSLARSDYAGSYASTSPAGPSSGGRGIPSSGDAERAVSTPEDGRIHVLKELEGTVESFRKGRVPKTDAISSVLRILGETADVLLTQPQKEATFDSYLTEILSIQSTFDEPRGTAVSHSETVDQLPGESHADSGHATRRAQGGAESESDDEDDKPSKRQRLLESDMPWCSDLSLSTSRYSNPSCKETCRLLRAFNRDISKAKFYVKIAPNSPAGIPSSQWERILKGDAVDLNQIFASLHHVVPDEERTGRLGEAEITFGVTEAKKRVATAAEWSTAWKRASKAIGFAFPHRREELSDYGDYIESEFAAKLPSTHHKLILYDVALRNEVAAGQHTLLTDLNKFSRLYSAIILPDGVEGDTGKSAGKGSGKPRQGNGKPETCNKFNVGTCQKLDSDCKYRHVCKKCNKPGHGKNDCSEGSK